MMQSLLAGKLTLLRATMKGVFRSFRRFMDSIVCGSSPCIKSTTKIAMSQRPLPRDRKLLNDSCPAQRYAQVKNHTPQKGVDEPLTFGLHNSTSVCSECDKAHASDKNTSLVAHAKPLPAPDDSQGYTRSDIGFDIGFQKVWQPAGKRRCRYANMYLVCR